MFLPKKAILSFPVLALKIIHVLTEQISLISKTLYPSLVALTTLTVNVSQNDHCSAECWHCLELSVTNGLSKGKDRVIQIGSVFETGFSENGHFKLRL